MSRVELGPTLAPTFDHASSLGYLLSDDQRRDRLDTNDTGFTVEAYARRARSRHFDGTPDLVTLAASAVRIAGPPTGDALRTRLASLDETLLTMVIEDVPAGRMSQAARTFACRMLVENRRRLLDAIDG